MRIVLRILPVWEASDVTYFIASGLELAMGDVIDEDTFAESPHKVYFEEHPPVHLRGVVDYQARRESERILESCREQGFPSAPSRARAIFLNLTQKDAVRWTSKEARASYYVYELASAHIKSIAEANYVWFNYLVRLCRDPERGN